MARILGFALGYLTDKITSENSDSLLSLLRKLNFAGIEITFADKERLYACKLSSKVKKILKKFQYVSIHAPFGLVKKAENEKEIIRQMDIIARLYSEIGAKNVVIHPDNLPSLKILSKYNLKISTENLKKKRNITIVKFRKIFKKYPKLGFCIDTSHAYSWSKCETGKLVKTFKNRISQIHLSARYKGKDHRSLRGGASKDFMFSIATIKKLDVPLMIEEGFDKVNAKSIKEEITYIEKCLLQ